jgi:hypothetical protein
MAAPVFVLFVGVAAARVAPQRCSILPTTAQRYNKKMIKKIYLSFFYYYFYYYLCGIKNK